MLCCLQCVRCAHLNSEPLAEQRLACCSKKAGGNPQSAGSITICLEKGGALYRIVLLAARALLSPQQRAVGCLARRALQQQSWR